MSNVDKEASNAFRRAFVGLARSAARYMGSAWAFAIAVGTVIVWAATGPAFHYSESWQLVINTGTTIVTFLMVFLIQHSQNRDTTAIHLKLSELVRAVEDAENSIIDAENQEESQLTELTEHYQQIADAAKKVHEGGHSGGVV